MKATLRQAIEAAIESLACALERNRCRQAKAGETLLDPFEVTWKRQGDRLRYWTRVHAFDMGDARRRVLAAEYEAHEVVQVTRVV